MIVPEGDASGARVKCPTPEDYVELYKNDKVQLYAIRKLYKRNAEKDPRPEWQEIWKTALQRFDAAVSFRGIPL